MMNHETLTMTVDEMAKAIRVSRTTAYEMAHRADFYPAVFIGGKILINRANLLKWLDEGGDRGRM